MTLARWQRKAHVGENRRGEFRAVCAGDVVIDVLSPRAYHSVKARVLDVSTGGLMLALPFALTPGALIRITMTEAIADAEVRYCTMEGSEHHIGVKVLEIAPRRD
jgi:c-di-GMP-binding flagellar brake protein YcgR